MDLNPLYFAIRDIDSNNTFLVLLLGLSAVYFIREFLEPPIWLFCLTVPSIIGSAFIGVGVMKVNMLFISSEEGVNTILGSISGIILSFIVISIIYRLTAEVTEETGRKPYKTKHPVQSETV